jgi:excisionase family DNA binding protein
MKNKLEPEWFTKWFSRIFEEKEVYNPLEIAKALNKHPETIYRALRCAELEGIKIGKRSYIVPKDALKKWLLEYNVINVDKK